MMSLVINLHVLFLLPNKNGASIRIALESVGLMMEGLEKDGHFSVPRTTRNWSTVRSYTNACVMKLHDAFYNCQIRME